MLPRLAVHMNLIRATIAATALVAGITSAATSNVGKRYPSEKRVYDDPVTGIPITVLTADPGNDEKIYQTHPQWTSDGKWIIFRSSRATPADEKPEPSPSAAPEANPAPVTDAPAGSSIPTAPAAPPLRPRTQAFALNEQTGDIVQLTDGRHGYSGMLNIARKSMKLYFLRYPGANAAAQMIEMNLELLLADSAAGTMKDSSAYERVCGTLPAGMRDSGGFGLDADEAYAYIGVRGGDCGDHLPPGTKILETQPGQRMGAGPAGLRSMNLQTGEVKVIIDTPFLMGHVQTNPWVPGEIVYCHETGGDAPQRIWTVRADGTGNRPLYVETPDEWITHEAVITKDEVVFNIMGHQPRLRHKPTGIAVINLRTDLMKLYGQVEDQLPEARGTGGFWHSNGSPDGHWLVGDTFAGNLWLIDRRTGAQTLLTTDHKMKPDHMHPTFSPDSTRILIQSGHFTDGKTLDLMIVPVPQRTTAALR